MSNRISASFSPVSNAGVILFWKTHQVVIGFMCIIWCLMPLFLGGSLFQLTNIPAFLFLLFHWLLFMVGACGRLLLLGLALVFVKRLVLHVGR